MPRPSRRRIPVVIVAGFLGSGKTTLLNHLLGNADGVRIGVVVNDFGSINVDAMSVAGQVDSMMALQNGCLCCAVDASGMDGILTKLTRSGTDLDLIVIEASGLAEPRSLVRLVLASTNPVIEYGGLIVVVDAAEFETGRARHPELADHVRIADLVVLNKTDRVPDHAGLLATVRALADGAPVLPTAHGRVDPALLFDAEPRERDTGPRQLSFEDLRADLADGHDHHDHHEHGACADHLHAAYESTEFSVDAAVHPRRLMRFLESRPAGLYRMKGDVYFGVPGHRQRFRLHTVCAYLRFHRSRWPEGEPRGTRLVLIGTGLDRAVLDRQLHECVEPEPDQVDPQAMLRILRHTES
ncbi:G3E family GTPase [Prauserella shujinwangii]|uniref:G3E family GTPase n=1 Tax=Prauserella shujinwangii TaxID=1453103 RepID=A0A2T0LWM8_9PSEU|nr:CobW family GTP-binding protein [Prauserella shujinwangii]PRX48431.1 G3E family GTPase [Prauserella shujinwangii]